LKDARRTYNLGVQFLRQSQLIEKGISSVQIGKQLQKTFISKESLKKLGLLYLERTPNVIRQQSLMTLVSHIKAYKTNRKNRLALRAKYPDAQTFQLDLPFRFQFKPKWVTIDSMKIESKSFRWINEHQFNLFSRFKPSQHILDKMETRDVITSEMLKRDMNVCFQYGKWYLSVPMYLSNSPITIPDTKRDSICALDPGVRKFMTVYSPEGKVELLGSNPYAVLDPCIRAETQWKNVVARRCKKYKEHKEIERNNKYKEHKEIERINNINPLKSKRWKKARRKKGKIVKTLSNPSLQREKRKLKRSKRRYHKALQRSSNVVKDMHYKVAHYLCRNYKQIILPYFNPQQCSRRHSGRKIGVKTVRRMTQLRHNKFKDRLIETMTKYADTTLWRGSEAYTSKQCGCCGRLNDTLGGSETFQCQDCGLSMDRDVHGARNILLRFLT
jgi:transposase